MHPHLDNERFRKLLLAYPAKAVRFLHQWYYHKLLAISEYYTHNRKASEDIVLEAFTIVWENHRWLSVRNDKPIIHYLVRVVRNKSISCYWDALKNSEGNARYVHQEAGSGIQGSVEYAIIEGERSQHMRRVIETFPRREKQCLLMLVEDDLSPREIAMRLQVSIKAVQRSLTSAYKRLRSEWQFIQ